jgi:TnpA family transposase
MIKNNSINIFYGRGEYEENCNLVNYKKVYSLIKNTLIFSNNKLLDKLLKEI